MNQVKLIHTVESRLDGELSNYLCDEEGITLGEIYSGADALMVSLCVNAFHGLDVDVVRDIIQSETFKDLLLQKKV